MYRLLGLSIHAENTPHQQTVGSITWVNITAVNLYMDGRLKLIRIFNSILARHYFVRDTLNSY
jgi:hypothetical protein